ncbi:uncharacterized protein B0I36DRAFT_366318 [Microdochium trichocladiopsis]|uniref:Uncharacterized protein n=1 Tax=Microdochium trichocladiopsis TaxID=1682393 RepID=A0A9P8Y035_9PEZI|nr:uncharacterized protein B0I36DRAFT_366318 [Microdochium trichocladiopsis]KAH7024367.1 hypothetical protein B0I36DRAFT_366318 [Microdochium trichocladiopsis]
MRSHLFSLLALVATTLATPFVEFDLGPENALEARTWDKDEKCVEFVYGHENKHLGKCCVKLRGKHLHVEYPDIKKGEYTDVNVIVQTHPITEENHKKWPHKSGHEGPCRYRKGKASCKIDVHPSWRECGKKLYIGVHGDCEVHGKHERGWGYGQCIKKNAPGNCPKSFDWNKQCPMAMW